jgi:hypothetical protein
MCPNFGTVREAAGYHVTSRALFLSLRPQEGSIRE